MNTARLLVMLIPVCPNLNTNYTSSACGCAKQAHAGPHDGEAGRLATQVSNLGQQLHAAQAATAAAQQESNHLRHKQQVHSDMPGMNCQILCLLLTVQDSQSMAVFAYLLSMAYDSYLPTQLTQYSQALCNRCRVTAHYAAALAAACVQSGRSGVRASITVWAHTCK